MDLRECGKKLSVELIYAIWIKTKMPIEKKKTTQKSKPGKEYTVSYQKKS